MMVSEPGALCAGAQRVVARANGFSATFDAVGCNPNCQSQQLVFVNHQGFQRVNVGGVVTSFVSAVQVSQPAWSPNGERLAFVKYENQTENMYVMNADGTGARRIATNAHSPSWSPDNRTLVVAVGVCVYDCALARLDADDPQQPAQAIPSMAGSLPAWSPDGQKIAYVSLSGDDGFHQLRTMNADGTGDAAVSIRDHGWIPGASWSPDGKSLAFSWCHAAKCDIHIASGGAMRQLTTSGTAHGAAWSPDGSKIAFMLPDGYDAYFTHVAYVDVHSGGDFVVLSSGGDPAWVPRPPAAGVRR
jgi:Tol biopolymer transport system component